MIGNPHTFKNSRKGAEVWTKLFELLEKNKHLYDGFPVRCQQHPSKTSLLKIPANFDEQCPDGGCAQPCGALLQCKIHTCSSKCHKLLDHSLVKCKHIVNSKCPRGHSQQWVCQGPTSPPCRRCEREQREDEKRLQEAFERQQKRDAEALEYAKWIASIDAKLAEQREIQRDAEVAEERRNAIQQKERDLQDAIAQNARKSFFSFFSSKPSSTTQGTQSSQSPQASSNQPTTAANASSTSPPPRSSTNSRAGDLWQYQKDVLGENNRAIDEIIHMTGLEEVKLQVLRIKDKVDTSIRQNVSFSKERFNVAMLGNPGTGKTTIARLYGQFLASMKVLPGKQFLETTGARLANEGVSGAKQHIDAILKEGGGTIFIDEAYQLTADHIPGGKNVLDFLLAELENRVGQIVFIFAGYNKEMEAFFEHNPGLPSRVPYTFQFKDYDDADLMDMLEMMIEQWYQGRMKVDGNDGIRGLHGRIVVRRLGRGRGTKGFGNARALQNVFAKIRERQADRVTKARREGHSSDDFLLTKDDLIGPPPSKVMAESVAWKKLQGMIGLGEIKTSVKNFFEMVNMNYDRELLEKKPHQVSLNRVFLGSPGTGKTTVAKLYGQILAELGLLSSGEVVIKNPSDFVGNVLGASESQTKAILAATVGKVLVIDEAYMLYGGSKNGGQDSFKTAVIDTIVAEVQSVPGEDRCVLLLGYKEQMEEMFQNVNPGLSRRFAIEDAFHFKDYTEAELLQALEFKLKEHDLTATDAAKKVAMDNLNRARNRPNFGNIGEVENLLNQAKIRYQARQALLPADQRSPDAPFEREDFDPEHDRNEHAATNLLKLFADVVGCDQIVEKLGNWQKMAKNMKALGKDPRDFIPTSFIFKGPPGTGKTTTARKMGQVYYDMGFLSSVEVVECSASDLVGQYVGHTGPKTKKLFEKALGRVLFIDEAYRLSQGQFAQEAIDELVGILTQEKFRGKLIVILAGYDQDMNQLIAINSGLSSRFPEEVVFPNIPPEQCMKILKLKLLKENVCLSALDDPSSRDYSTILDFLEDLSNLPSWGNARDIETLAKKMIEKVFTLPIGPNAASATIPLPAAEAISCIEAMLTSRQERTGNLPPTRRSTSGPFATQQNTHSPPPVGTGTGTSAKTPSKGALGHSPPTPAPVPQPPRSKANQRNTRKDSDTQRDSGVSDADWEQLQRDRKAAEDAMNRVQEEQRKTQKAFEEAVKRAKEAQARAKAEAEALAKAREQAVAAAVLKQKETEAARRREAARIAEEKVKAEKARREAARKEAERKKAEEAAVQTKLRSMGVCVQGFRWIPQSGGYRCAGGSHFISNAALGRN